MMSTMAYHEMTNDDDFSYGDKDMEEHGGSVLLGLVQSYDWAGSLARIASHREETKMIGEEGRTPLHVACDHDAPAVVVQALLEAYPQASVMIGTTHMNPLHITCSSQHASVQVIRVLLEGGIDVQTSMRDVDGDTPLHAACRCGAPIEVLDVLLRAYPSAVNERDYEGLTPLLRLWVRYFVILGDDAIHGVNGPADITGELGEAWKKTELLLRCAYTGSVDGEGFSTMHAVAAVDCPRPIVKIATIVYPQQLDQKDDKGRTPLHIAAQAPIFKVRDLSDDGYLLEDVIHGDHEMSDDDRPNDDSDSAHPSVIEILLQASAEPSTVTDPNGRLPLHLALASGKRWTEGVKNIVQSNPEAVTVPDPLTGLYPFTLAAVGSKADCGTIYDILRTNPAVALKK